MCDEVLQCHILPHNGDEEYTWHSDPIVFTDKEVSPIELIPGKKYIFTKWDQNVIVEALEDNKFKVLDSYYGDIIVGEEYICFKPKY